MAWYKVTEAEDLCEPFLRKLSAGGKSICVVNTVKEVFALAATCPHAGADLSKGWFENGQLVCPFHRYAYDLHTGRGASGQNDFVQIYPVQIRGDGLYIQVSSRLTKLKKLLGL
jgi:nitrite reductase/ring-hydroxylating ferredoxin subunit